MALQRNKPRPAMLRKGEDMRQFQRRLTIRGTVLLVFTASAVAQTSAERLTTLHQFTKLLTRRISCEDARRVHEAVARGHKSLADETAYGALYWPLLRVKERPVSAASPKVNEDDHTCDRRVRTPQRRKGIPLHRHYNQDNRQVCRAEDYHRPHLREKQRTARCNHIQQRNRRVVCRLIDVHNTVSLDVHLQWVRRQRPQYIKRRCSAEREERQHAPAALHVSL